MDNRPLELQAESIINSRLIKHGFNVNKPCYDKEGADLLIIKDISEKITPIVKIQCKGRTVKTSSNVTIPVKYVEENLVVFLYVEEDRTKDEFIYVFFQDDINSWQHDGKNFKLSIPNNFRDREYFKERILTNESPLKIEKILLRQAADRQLIKTNYSVIIDGIFLEQIVLQARKIYKEIYPEKILCKPNIDDIIEQILKYAPIKQKEEVNCYLIYSEDFSLGSLVNIGEEEYDLSTGEKSTVGSSYNLFKLKTKDFVYFKVKNQVERIINVEHVFLVADDFAYVPYLQELEDRGVEIIIFQNSENADSRMYHKFKWANISYPIALAMGLEQYEL